VSSKTPQSAGKITVECTHCGFKQLESPFAKSTFCRRCSQHYELGRPDVASSETKLSFFARLGVSFAKSSTRVVTCFDCGSVHTISSSASSSLCRQCGAYIEVNDFKIASTFSRSVTTQGNLHVTPKGDVTSARVACANACVEGKFRGNLVCTGAATLKMKGKLLGALDVNRLVIDKQCEVEVIRPVRANSVQITGKIKARITVDGAVIIKKNGRLEGALQARSITVEKGGIFVGDLCIGSPDPAEPELVPVESSPAADEPTPIIPPDHPSQDELRFGSAG
jgi:cytoskeletal protein CcmA (bactofilin family)